MLKAGDICAVITKIAQITPQMALLHQLPAPVFPGLKHLLDGTTDLKIDAEILVPFAEECLTSLLRNLRP